MSKLDNIILKCINKALDGKEEKLGDYVDPTKQQIKDLMQEIIDDTVMGLGGDVPYGELTKKIEEL
jgi:hypothetical protein